MNIYIIILFFVVIAIMRVIQKVCSKVSSEQITDNKTFFAYGALYQCIAAAFALITVVFTGFHNFNTGLIVCSILSAVLFAVDLFTGLEAVKGCSIAVATMFSLGGLVISVVVSYFWFGEEIKSYQIAGLCVFFVSAYLLSSKDGESGEKISAKTFLMLFVNFLANGLVMVVQKYFALKVEGTNTPLFSFVTFALCGVFMLACFAVTCIRNKHREKPLQKDCEKGTDKPVLNKKLVICGILLALALFLINIMITEMSKTVPSIIVFPVSSAISILIAVLVGYLVFKEKLSIKKIIGLIVGVASIIILGV